VERRIDREKGESDEQSSHRDVVYERELKARDTTGALAYGTAFRCSGK
jgi:hypothetical protein